MHVVYHRAKWELCVWGGPFVKSNDNYNCINFTGSFAWISTSGFELKGKAVFCIKDRRASK